MATATQHTPDPVPVTYTLELSEEEAQALALIVRHARINEALRQVRDGNSSWFSMWDKVGQPLSMAGVDEDAFAPFHRFEEALKTAMGTRV